MTSTTQNGNIGGLDAADALCQSRADGARLPGTYMAWLSDSSGSPSSRFRRSNRPYVLVGGERIADSWDDLTTQKPNGRYIARPINQSETGAELGGGTVWTNTDPNGTDGEANQSCEGWATSALGSTGIVGNLGALSAHGSEWTRGALTIGCNSFLRLYCFQQE